MHAGETGVAAGGGVEVCWVRGFAWVLGRFLGGGCWVGVVVLAQGGEHEVADAPGFEGARGLKVFEFEVDVAACGAGEGCAAD